MTAHRKRLIVLLCVFSIVVIAGCAGSARPMNDTPERRADQWVAELRDAASPPEPGLVEKWLIELRLRKPRQLVDPDTIIKRLQVQDREAAARPLIRALNDKDAAVRYWATRAIRSIGPAAKDTVPALIAALRDNDVSVRRCAASALGETGPVTKDVVPAFIAVLNDVDPDVRWYAVCALGNIGPAAKDAVPALIAALNDPSVRYMAARTLGYIGPAAKDALPALTDALKDKDELVRATAADAIQMIQAPPASKTQ